MKIDHVHQWEGAIVWLSSLVSLPITKRDEEIPVWRCRWCSTVKHAESLDEYRARKKA